MLLFSYLLINTFLQLLAMRTLRHSFEKGLQIGRVLLHCGLSQLRKDRSTTDEGWQDAVKSGTTNVDVKLSIGVANEFHFEQVLPLLTQLRLRLISKTCASTESSANVAI